MSKDIRRELRTHIVYALFRQVTFLRILRIHNQMHVRMMSFVMKRAVPTEVFKRDFEVLRHHRRFRAKHITPTASVIVAEPFRILPSKRKDYRPYVPVVFVEFRRHRIQIDRLAVVREQSVRAEPFRPRTRRNIVRIRFLTHCRFNIFFHDTGNEFGRVPLGRILAVVIVLVHVLRVRKISQEFLDDIALFEGSRYEFKRLVYLFHALSRSNIFCVAANLFQLVVLQVLELCY